jgi:hypothetical protein
MTLRNMYIPITEPCPPKTPKHGRSWVSAVMLVPFRESGPYRYLLEL